MLVERFDDDYFRQEGAKNVFRESQDKEKAIGLKQRQNFQAAVKAGVRMAFGTDAGGPMPVGDSASQFATMAQWGMTSIRAVQAATVDAAEALGRTDNMGEGKTRIGN